MLGRTAGQHKHEGKYESRKVVQGQITDHQGLIRQTKEFGFYPISIRASPRFFSSQNRDWEKSGDVIRAVVQNNKTGKMLRAV